MGIQQICQSIKNYFNNVRPPFPQLPRLLLVCSMMRRPGLSTIQSTANIVKDLNKLGIPTGPMPHGCDNMSVAFAFAYVKEAFRAFKNDANGQAGALNSSIQILPNTMSNINCGTIGGKIN